MQKNIRRAQIAALIAAALLLSALLLWPRAAAPSAPSAILKDAAQGLDQVSYDLLFKPDSNSLAVTMQWPYQNRGADQINDLVVRLYARAFEFEETSPAATAELYDSSYPGGFSPASCTMHDLFWNDAAVDWAFDQKDATVLRLSIPPLASGETGVLRLRCVIGVPDCRYLFGRAEGIWMLGRCLPFVAARTANGWQTAPYPVIGDPEGPPPANYRLSLSLPQGYECAAPVAWRRSLVGGMDRLEGEALAARDISLVISDRLTIRQTIANGVLLQSFAGSGEDAARALTFCEKALERYADLFGPYPYPVYTAVSVPLPADGAESTALSMLGSARYQDASALELTIAHETAHQWFGILVGSDPIRSAWQDEAVCEWAVLQYALDTHGRDAYDQLVFLRADMPMREKVRNEITVSSPVDRFHTYQEYGTVVYGRGLSMLISLERDIDLRAFFKRYAADFAWRTADRADFERLLSDTAGWDVVPLMTDFLDTAI